LCTANENFCTANEKNVFLNSAAGAGKFSSSFVGQFAKSQKKSARQARAGKKNVV